MSRIGKKPIPVPAGVTIEISKGSAKFKGPQGELTQKFPESVTAEHNTDNNTLNVIRHDEEKESSAFQGLTRALLANAIAGVTQGFMKSLDVVGTGYNAKLGGKHLELSVGFCLPQKLMIPEGIKVEVPEPTRIVIKGCDKQVVGQFAAVVRAVRPPDAYKGKGIRYSNEVIKLKASKGAGK